MGFDIYGQTDRGTTADGFTENYFRNNVWWWRRLWEFTCVVCDDILSDEDKVNGTMNNCHRIPEDKAIAIADRLHQSLVDGVAKRYSAEVAGARRKAKANNAKVQKDDPDYWNKYDWAENYPFSVTNVREFEKFCRNSGGFEIC
jgi:hypothetical protein